MTPSRLVGFVLAAGLLAGCSGSSSAGAPAPDAVAPSSAAPTVAFSPTPSSVASATPSPSAAAAHAAVDGDVDGDGQPDQMSVAESTLTVTLSASGRIVRTDVDAGLDGSEPAGTAGSHDVDRDGHAEVFVRVGQGASTQTLRAFRYDGTALRPVDRADGPLLLVIGGSVTHGDGFSCTDTGRLVVRSAESSDGKAFVVTSTTYRLSGSTAVRIARTTAHAAGMDNPAVAAAYRVDCGPVGEGD